jgi:predicted nucleic acid-binding protein
MIVVDSSVWIGHFRGADTPAVKVLNAVRRAHRDILVGDLILLEILQGARDEAHARRLELDLRKLSVERMLDDEIAVAAASNYRILRTKGVTIRSTIDLIIATFCIERGHALLHDDRDFDPLAIHLGLLVV